MNVLLIAFIILIAFIAFIIAMGQVAFSITPRPNTENPTSRGIPFEDIYFTNQENHLLHAWWMPHAEATALNPLPALVVIHGWNRNCARMLNYLEQLKGLRINILCIEARGHGENNKNSFITELGFARDIQSALDWLVLKPEVHLEGIGVLGHSVGAAATIFATSIDKRIKYFIADASFAHPRDIIRNMLKSYHIPYYPIGWLIVQYIQLRLGVTLDSIAPVNVVSKISVPGLLIHGNEDSVVPVEDSFRIIAHAGSEINLWIANGATHSTTSQHPEFRQVLREFLDSSIQAVPTSNQGHFLSISSVNFQNP